MLPWSRTTLLLLIKRNHKLMKTLPELNRKKKKESQETNGSLKLLKKLMSCSKSMRKTLRASSMSCMLSWSTKELQPVATTSLTSRMWAMESGTNLMTHRSQALNLWILSKHSVSSPKPGKAGFHHLMSHLKTHTCSCTDWDMKQTWMWFLMSKFLITFELK